MQKSPMLDYAGLQSGKTAICNQNFINTAITQKEKLELFDIVLFLCYSMTAIRTI